MLFLRRAFVGLFLLSVTAGLLAVAGNMLYGAVQERMSREAFERPARERVAGVNVVQVELGRQVPILTAFGEVLSRRTLELRAGTGGRVVWLSDSFEEGGRVMAGDLLARIDPTDAESALAVARTDLSEAEAELRDAERAIGLAEDELTAARNQSALRAQALERQENLLRRGVGSAQNVETAKLALSTADQSVLSRRQALAQAESRVDQAKNRLARQKITLANAERDLADTEIRAAFTGTLAQVTLVEGRLVTPNERVAELIDPEALEVQFRLSTAQYSRLLGDDGRITAAPVQVSLDVLGLDLVVPGRIARVSASVGDGQTGRAIFATLDQFAGFRPGDFVQVRIEEPALDQVALVPATALDAASTVLVIGKEERLESAAVTLLRRQGDDVIIRADSLDKALIVAERSPLVGPGIRVKPLGQPDAEQPARAVGQTATGGEPEMVELTAERRAKLIAFVEANKRMPAEARERVLSTLGQDKVPARVVNRLESRMGG